MCVCFWWRASDPNSPIKLVIVSNRDEFLDRPAKRGKIDVRGPHGTPPAAFFGIDLLANGTWLAVHEDGRYAVVLNNDDFKGARPNYLYYAGIYALFVAIGFTFLPLIVVYVLLLPIYIFALMKFLKPASRGAIPLDFILGDTADPQQFAKALEQVTPTVRCDQNK